MEIWSTWQVNQRSVGFSFWKQILFSSVSQKTMCSLLLCLLLIIVILCLGMSFPLLLITLHCSLMAKVKFSTYLYENEGVLHIMLHVLYVWNNYADLKSDHTAGVFFQRSETLVACRQTASGLEIDLFLTWYVSVSERESVDEVRGMERW